MTPDTRKAWLQLRAEVAMFGCLACAQPWMVAGNLTWIAWSLAAMLAWLVARSVAR